MTRHLTILLPLLVALLAGCTDREWDQAIAASRAETMRARLDVDAVRQMIQADTQTDPDDIAKLKRRLDKVENVVTKAEKTTDIVEDAAADGIDVSDVGRAVGPLLPFPFNFLVGAASIYMAGRVRRQWVENKMAPPPVLPPTT